jgi:GNAT superfamily N-acetyltransferase
MYIEILSYIQNKSARIEALKNILFLNAQSSVRTKAERRILFDKYAAPYIETWPDDVFFSCDLKTKETLGYLIGCKNSLEAEALFSPLIGSYSLFSDQFKKFPAHLHMNTHPNFHGRGVGTFLVQEYIIDLKRAKSKGVHIVTSPEQRNVHFYAKNIFTNVLAREYNNKKLLFMGRSL